MDNNNINIPKFVVYLEWIKMILAFLIKGLHKIDPEKAKELTDRSTIELEVLISKCKKLGVFSDETRQELGKFIDKWVNDKAFDNVPIHTINKNKKKTPNKRRFYSHLVNSGEDNFKFTDIKSSVNSDDTEERIAKAITFFRINKSILENK